MIVKPLLAVPMALALFSAAPAHPKVNPPWRFASDDAPQSATTATGIDPSTNPEVVRVQCLRSSGSAFRVGPHILLSVAHVTNNEGCFIGDEPVKVLRSEGDFSILRSEVASDKWLTVDCGGFQKGREYVAIGYARGLRSQTSVDLVATGQELAGFQKLWGVFTVVPGQSGGAIIDKLTRKVVGTINVYDPRPGHSGSVAIKDTSVCKA